MFYIYICIIYIYIDTVYDIYIYVLDIYVINISRFPKMEHPQIIRTFDPLSIEGCVYSQPPGLQSWAFGLGLTVPLVLPGAWHPLITV